MRRGQLEIAQEAARALGVAGRKIEELVEAASALACGSPVHRLSAADDSLAVHGDGCDERLGGIERKLRAARAACFVLPTDQNRIGCRGDLNRAGDWAGDVERDSVEWDVERDSERGSGHCHPRR